MGAMVMGVLNDMVEVILLFRVTCWNLLLICEFCIIDDFMIAIC